MSVKFALVFTPILLPVAAQGKGKKVKIKPIFQLINWLRLIKFGLVMNCVHHNNETVLKVRRWLHRSLQKKILYISWLIMLFVFPWRAVMNGVDLFIEAGRSQFYPDFIRELRRLMDSETGAAERTYLITAAPHCPYPDPFLGPEGAGTGKKNELSHFHVVSR